MRCSERLEELADRIRDRVLRLTPLERPSHVASALSAVDVLAAIYGAVVDLGAIAEQRPDRDRVILSKGHGALALYATLVECGLADASAIADYGPGAPLAPVHPLPRRLPGVDVATGSLGHGVALAAGAALASRLGSSDARALAVVGDGECQEGSIWEAALFAAQHGLGRLAVVVDANGLQQTGRVAEIGALEPLAAKWRAFGWSAVEVDGHQPGEIAAALARAVDGEPPTAVLARTRKGRGLAGVEDQPDWHFRALAGARDEAREDA